MSSDPQAAALLSHVVSQTEQNIQFLVDNNYISHADAAGFLHRLGTVSNGQATNAHPVPTPPRAASHAATSGGLKARAIWGYNENGAEPEDLSFSAGDVIDIIEETNADWWMGRVNGKQALFPSSYVERIEDAPPAPAPANSARALPPAYNGAKATGPKPAYKPFMAAHSSANAPPPPGAGSNSVGLQQDAGQGEKKSKFGKYGNTMAHSAAGGVGFGAGAAIGGGLVRAIF